MNRTPPSFNGYEPGQDFDRARSQIATPFQFQDFALDGATSNLIVNISGDFLYIDASSDGVATVELNNEYSDPAAPFQVSAGFGLQGLFKQLKMTWAAQPGKKLRVMWSTGYRIVPTNIMQLSVNSATRSTFGNTAKTVTGTSAQLVAANASRSYLLIQNNHATEPIYVNFGATATASNGVKIAAGGSYELNCNQASNAVNAISGGGSNASIVVVEG